MSQLSIVGIDPGRHTGLAIISRDALDSSGHPSLRIFDTLSGTKEGIIRKICSFVADETSRNCEPRCIVEQAVFRGSHSATKHGALINRAWGEFFAGVLWGKEFNVILKTPMEWKGNTPKLVTHARIVKVFGKQLKLVEGIGELADLPTEQPDALDALGIALAGLRNLDKWFSQ